MLNQKQLVVLRIVVFFTIAIAIVAMYGCRNNPQSSETYYVMGTVCKVNLFEDGTKERYAVIQNLLQSIEQTFSANKDGTNLDQINRAAGKHPVLVDKELFMVVQTALQIATESDGMFDPTIGSLVKLWNIGFENESVPLHKSVQAVLPLVSYSSLTLNPDTQTVSLVQPGMKLDLGGITKGAAADAIADYLQTQNVQQAIIDLGGNILLYGKKKDGNLWNVGIKDPLNSTGMPVLKIETDATSVVTSGIYERFFIKDGKSYHHILDPHTGYPVANDLLAVTVICPQSITADALSTAAFVSGREQSAKILAKFPTAQALFITKDRKIYCSDAIRSRITLLTDDYVLAE